MTVEDLKKTVDFFAHDVVIAGSDPLLQCLFETCFQKPILDFALKQAKGEASPQYEAEK
tara:strand:- start:137 stop:313 length:177 start_codon:yes stop_codon:yes gene_type:complete